MGELILCRSVLARVPYYVEEGGINLYSLEELSWYIGNHVYLLTPDFMKKDLCDWIRDEQGDKKLAGELAELIAEHVPVHIFCGHILEAGGYLTREETRSTVEKIKSLENRSEGECRKIRADHLLSSGKTAAALLEYDSLIDEKEELKLPSLLLGNICHNKGVALMRSGRFADAERSFKAAYQRNRSIDSLMSLLTSALMGGGKAAFTKEAEEFLVPPDVRGRALDAYTAALEKADKEEGTDPLDKKDLKDLKALVEGMKETYREADRI